MADQFELHSPSQDANARRVNHKQNEIELVLSRHHSDESELDTDEPLLQQSTDTEKATESDYYDMVVEKTKLEPICMSETFGEFGADNIGGTVQMVAILSVLVTFGIRLDRLFDRFYFTHHWKYWLFCTMLAVVVCITPDILKMFVDIDKSVLLSICIICLCQYYVGLVLWFKVIQPALYKRNVSKAKVLKFSEFILISMWSLSAFGFLSARLIPTPEITAFLDKHVPETVSCTLGVAIYLLGVAMRMSAVYYSGLNTYYWYDMVTRIPNARFISKGIYKYMANPTYHGYIILYGMAMFYRSLFGFMYGVAAHILIFVFVQVCEKPFVAEMYSD